MVAVKIADRNSITSEEKMEGTVGVRTVECLRGRLLAERMASKAAKEDAELLGKKLIELENKLRQEIKSKQRAEKKLSLLLKKLSHLEISYVAEASEPCRSPSENMVGSGGSSSVGMEEKSSMSRSGSTEECSSEGCTSETPRSPSTAEKNPDSVRSKSPSKTESKDDSADISIEAESNQSCVTEDSSDTGSPGSDSYTGGRGIDENGADNALALVLVPRSLQTEIDCKEQVKKAVTGDAGEMLDTLKHAREKIQSTLDRRCIRKKTAEYA